MSVLILPRLRAAAGRPGLQRLIDEARRRAQRRQSRALVVTLAVFGLTLGAFFLLHRSGTGVLWGASGSGRADDPIILVVGSTSYKRETLVVQGSTPVAPGEKLFLVYADGARERLEVIPPWPSINKPIRMGLYHRVISRVHRAYPRRPIAVELMHGTRTVARQAVLLPPG